MQVKNFFKDSLRKIFFGIIFTCVFFASQSSIGECRDVVFVLNSGNTMNISDPFHSAPESITWASENLSDNDSVGIVTFNDNVRIVRPLSKINENPIDDFLIGYSGQSEAGAALLSAIDMLTPRFNDKRSIVFITNGELGSSQSATNFQEGLRQANSLGIEVYLINLRYDVNPQTYRTYKDYVKELPINYNELMTTVRTILQGDWRTPHIELPVPNSTSGTFRFEVPVTSPSKLKIMLLSSNNGDLNLNGFPKVSKIQGKFINIFEVNAPSRNQFEMALNYPKGTGLTLDVLPTVNGALVANTTVNFWLEDILEITPLYAQTDSKIFDNKYFEGKKINLRVNDKDIVGEINGGSIYFPLNELELDAFDDKVSIQKVHFEDVGVIFSGNDTLETVVSKNHHKDGFIALLGLAIILGLAYAIHKKNNPDADKLSDLLEMMGDGAKALPPVEKVLDKKKIMRKVFYAGKLMIYVTKSPSNEEFEPREFNLLRANVENISLSEILTHCSIYENFSGTEKIFISPDDKGIVIENKSSCTITRLNVLMNKGARISMQYNDSLNIVTADETAELLLIYRNLKPN